jgi:hypothetical protein
MYATHTWKTSWSSINKVLIDSTKSLPDVDYMR